MFTEANLIRTLIGLPILFAGLAFMAGGVNNAILIATLLIVCTAGVSLVVILPMAWMIGWVVLELIAAAMRGRPTASG